MRQLALVHVLVLWMRHLDLDLDLVLWMRHLDLGLLLMRQLDRRQGRWAVDLQVHLEKFVATQGNWF